MDTYVIGYHGCTAAVAEYIFRTKEAHLNPSLNDYDWLGSGIYFWENDYARALSWAERASKGEEPAVIGAVIIPSNCLDLTTTEGIKTLQVQYLSWETALLASGIAKENFPKNKRAYQGDEDLLKRELDCSVIMDLHMSRKKQGLSPYDSVRGAFIEGNPVFPDSKIMDKTHIQWAIRNPGKCILGYFRPFQK